MYLRAKGRIPLLTRLPENLCMMMFTDDGESDLGLFFVHDFAGISKRWQFFSEHCFLLTLRDAIAVD